MFCWACAHDNVVLARLSRESDQRSNSGDINMAMDAEQELREYQREYLDFLDDGVRCSF